MSTAHVADRFVELCRRGQFETAHAELFATDTGFNQPGSAGVERPDATAAIRESGRRFMSKIAALRSVEVDDALVAGNYFSVSMSLESTVMGRVRATIEEVCVYCSVDRGMIVSEHLFRKTFA